VAPRHRCAGRRVFFGVTAIRRRTGTGLGRGPRPASAQTLAGHFRRPDGCPSCRGRGAVLRHLWRCGNTVPPPKLRRPSQRPRPRRVWTRMQWRR